MKRHYYVVLARTSNGAINEYTLTRRQYHSLIDTNTVNGKPLTLVQLIEDYEDTEDDYNSIVNKHALN